MNLWYLLYCKRAEQQRAKIHLKRQGVDCYYPQVTVEKIRRGKRCCLVEPLFPSYIFASFDFNQISFTTVRSTRGVVDFVRQGKMPIKVPLALLKNIMLNEDSKMHRAILSDEFPLIKNEDIVCSSFEGSQAIYQEPEGDKRSILLINIINNVESC